MSASRRMVGTATGPHMVCFLHASCAVACTCHSTAEGAFTRAVSVSVPLISTASACSSTHSWLGWRAVQACGQCQRRQLEPRRSGLHWGADGADAEAHQHSHVLPGLQQQDAAGVASSGAEQGCSRANSQPLPTHPICHRHTHYLHALLLRRGYYCLGHDDCGMLLDTSCTSCCLSERP